MKRFLHVSLAFLLLLSSFSVFEVHRGVVTSYASQNPTGEIQELNEDYIQGWAYDGDLGSLPVEVKIYIDGNYYDNTMADIALPSLVSSGITPDQYHGFIQRFNNFSFTPGNNYEITAFAVDDSTQQEIPLTGSPQTLSIPGGGGGGGGGTNPTAKINIKDPQPNTGDLVAIDATSSTTTSFQTYQPGPPANLTFNWVLTSTPPNSQTTLSSNDQVTITFTPDEIGDYEITLTVTDPANSQTDQTNTTITAVDSGIASGYTPDPIAFTDIFNAEINTIYTSNANVLTGFNGTTKASVSNGINTTIIKNGFDTGSTQVTVGNGDAIALKSTADSQPNVLHTIILTVGNTSAEWKLMTDPNQTPPPCVPSTKTQDIPGQYQENIQTSCAYIMFEAFGAGANGEYQTYTIQNSQYHDYTLTVGDPQQDPNTLITQQDPLTNNTLTILKAEGDVDPQLPLQPPQNPNGKIIITWDDTPPTPGGPGGGGGPNPPPSLPEIIYHHSDHLGSSSIDTDENGNIVELLDYYPFGTPRLNETPGDYEDDYKFTGKELDEDTSLYYYGARYYDHSSARFTAIDPASLYEPEQFLTDPQQLNTYSYVRNNPLKYVDPTGKYSMETGAVESGDTLSDITQQLNSQYGTSYSFGDIAQINNIANVNSINIGDTIRIGTLDGWQPPSSPGGINVSYWNSLSESQQKILHYHRNFYQNNLPATQSELNMDEWRNLGQATAHNLAGASGNLDFRGKGLRLGQQAIYDNAGNLVTSPENIGTFDFTSPSSISTTFNHLDVDVDPWIKWGNLPTDSTTKSGRIDAMRQTIKGRAGLQLLGY